MAEVLITLGIIGVVSAMTVPSLIQNYQRQSYVTQLHKIYNMLSQASMQYMTDRNAINLKEAGLNSQASIDEWFKSYFKVIKECKNDGSGCMAAGQYKRMNGKSVPSIGANEIFNYYVLADGTAISYYLQANGIIQINVDVNGKKGPNIIGRDTFAIAIYSNGVLDDHQDGIVEGPLTKEKRDEIWAMCNQNTNSGWWGCFGKILNDNWQMTY